MLTVRGLTKSYATPDGRFQALKGIDFEVPAGGFYTLLGESGCGKSTTLRCVAGLEEPDGGSISIGGEVVADPDDPGARFLVERSYYKLRSQLPKDEAQHRVAKK